MPGIKNTSLRSTPVRIPPEKPMWWTGGHYPGTSAALAVRHDQGTGITIWWGTEPPIISKTQRCPAISAACH